MRKTPAFSAVNMPFSPDKRYVYLKETCPFRHFVNIIYLSKPVLSSFFSISSQNPYKTAVTNCKDFRFLPDKAISSKHFSKRQLLHHVRFRSVSELLFLKANVTNGCALTSPAALGMKDIICNQRAAIRFIRHIHCKKKTMCCKKKDNPLSTCY